MATGGLYGNSPAGNTVASPSTESSGLYGNTTSFGGTYFEYFIFIESATVPATPTGGSWSFTTNTGTPPTGWSNTPPVAATNPVYLSIALVNSRAGNTLTWSTPGRIYKQGDAATVAVGTTTTGAAGTSASVTNSGTAYAAVFNFTIPRGDTGATGTAATVAVGTTTTGAAGTAASVTNSGTSSAAVFNFTIPQGATGPGSTVAAGTTTTGAAGTSASVTNSGTSTAAVFNFTIPRGDTGAAASVAVGTTTTLSAGSSATVTNSGSSSAAVFNFGIPQGVAGTAATIAAGTTTTGAAGTSASVTNSGTSSAAVFNFTIPRGDTGSAATVAVGTTTTGAAGSSASVTNSGTSSAAVFNFTIPRGDTGATGAGVITGGTAGQALTKINSTDYNTQWSNVISSVASADGSVAVTTVAGAVDLSVAVAAATTNVICQVRNTTGATLTKGTAVYISGATGQIPTVSKALATSDATSAQTLGLMTDDLANNTNGYVTVIGLISNINTSAYTDGQQLYLSGTTAGTLTATKPYAPIHLVYVAVVEHAHPTQGKLFVKVQNGYELDEIHNVSAQTPFNGQTIVWNSTTSLWENNTVGLTNGVNGTLPIANGGTNSTATPTAGGVAYGTGTAYAITSAGTANQLLLSNAASAPSWSSLKTVASNPLLGSGNVTFDSLTPTQTSNAGKVLTTNGTIASWSGVSGGTF